MKKSDVMTAKEAAKLMSKCTRCGYCDGPKCPKVKERKVVGFSGSGSRGKAERSGERAVGAIGSSQGTIAVER